MAALKLFVALTLVYAVTAVPQRAGLVQFLEATKALGYQHNNIFPKQEHKFDPYTYNGDPMTDTEIIPGQMNNYGKYSYGCRDGYCWVQCRSFPVDSWCWSTPTWSYSQSYQYVTCREHSDCTNRLQCATPCI
ncbi:hypothetical protein B5X24_HaOG202674 [Helicoverpa armigera]|uniref:Uncharacterized protein n=1 Tax=Helicoverpa armigera TaxID=29058 RepID=A0A2W1BSE3_HELAM|nr:hypothetical protein B5X24_HaOG202674 [Helicoverpa armigera]